MHHTVYEACPESKDTSRVGRQGNFLCLLWQHCRQPSSFITCEPCSFDSGRTGFFFEWDVFEKAAPIQSPAKGEVRSVIRVLNAKVERPAEIYKQIVAVYDTLILYHSFMNCGLRHFGNDLMQLSYRHASICANFSFNFLKKFVRDQRWSTAPLSVVNISPSLGEFTAPLCHILPNHNVTIRANRRVTVRELHHIIPEVSKTTIHEAVTQN